MNNSAVVRRLEEITGICISDLHRAAPVETVLVLRRARQHDEIKQWSSADGPLAQTAELHLDEALARLLARIPSPHKF